MTTHSSPTAIPRADFSGGLVLPQILRQARYYRVPPADLRAAEDEAVSRLIRLQSENGLTVFSDGQLRHQFAHTGLLPKLCPQTADFPADHPLLIDFAALRRLVKPGMGQPKAVLPAPQAGDIGGAKTAACHAGLVSFWHAALDGFYKAGCRYLQLDLAIPRDRAEFLADLALLEQVLSGRPEGLRISLYLPSLSADADWQAERIFQLKNTDVWMIGMQPCQLSALRFFPKGPGRVMAGLICAASPCEEDAEALCHQLCIAARFVAGEQLGLAMTGRFRTHGAVDELRQKRKLALLKQATETFWGRQECPNFSSSGDSRD